MLRCFSEGVAVKRIPCVANQVFFFLPSPFCSGGRGEKVSVVKPGEVVVGG